MPQRDKWYPSGLTPRKLVRRLLPNHFLELSNFKVIRHWPGNTELKVNPETKGSIKEIVKLVKNNIYAIERNFPLYIPLTAGRDSWMLLACAKEITSRIDFFTICGKKTEKDCYIASKIRRRFNLNHRLLQIEPATQDQLGEWLYRSGYCVSGQTWKNHQTAVRHLDINRAVLLGLASPVGKASYCRKTDTESTQLTPEEILRRLRLPADGETIKMTRDWFAEISHLNPYLILDLTYIEQRLGCWGGPQLYGQRRMTAPYLLPFCHRKIFELMLKLPYEYRQRQELTIDILRQEWPELLDLPFNSFTGIRAYINPILKALRQMKKKHIPLKNKLFAPNFKLN